MSDRGTTTTEADLLRSLGDRVATLERLAHLKGTVSVGRLRIGGFVIETNGGTGDLQIRRLSDNATTLLMAD